ncbi:hypothetical protein I317_03771 [Kwoniella heveanensis CBS 569]|uniref:Uncharacterized protein n=1 Tax=Kwoniella heveanensis BCC8398 TaxID=1296120 RepID=A0A1B9GUI8_9TREE|nr:hypothetical protein I316_03739 [Kwoniella heveanensis BCC8398]OCF42396.1 hypothetical protein I317_03771 [Kwoniella heveanensis CBS 569]
MATTTGRYVPPSRRAGYASSLTSNDLPPPGPRPIWQNRSRASPDDFLTVYDMSQIFNHPQDSTLTFFSYPYTSWPARPPRPAYDPTLTAEQIPLPPSPPPPPPTHPLAHLLSYVVLFPNAHPAWKPKSEVWTHTNADILIEDFEGARKNFGRPIPVFQWRRGGYRRQNPRDWTPRQSNDDRFEFIGWWTLETLEVVPAMSEELRKMMQIKEEAKSYGREGRTTSAWAASLSTKWIRLGFTNSEGDFKHPGRMGKGEGEKYLLEIGDLKEEKARLEGADAD